MRHEARRFSGTLLIVEMRPNRQSQTRLGITVTRRYGKAHLRNRFKRIVREAFRTSYSQLPQGLDLLIKPQSASLSASPSQIAAELLSLIASLK